MKYLYYDLGEQEQEKWVVAHLRGSSANVILLDRLNFERYRFGRPFQYTGGLHTRTPARLQIPQGGHWYLVIDCGGYRHHVHPESVEILAPDESPTASDRPTASDLDELAAAADVDESPAASEAEATPVGATA